jgi:FKBP-type peptidyl-prolyl cis-trans isomerase FklB
MMRNLKFLFVLVVGIVLLTACKEDEHADWKILNSRWLEQHKNDEGFQRTESGLYYRVIHQGFMRFPNANSVIRAQYTGKLIDGKTFDQGEFYNSLSRSIPGWQEGLRLMRGGARFQFYIPAELAYGKDGQGAIPPHSVLIFDITLIESFN